SSRILIILTVSWLAITPAAPVSADGPAGESLPGGVVYREYTLPDGPWAIQVLEIPRKSKDAALGVALGGKHILGLESLDSMASRVSAPNRQAVAGVNGDFFIIQRGPYQGDPVGLCVTGGELVSTPIRRSAAVILQNGEPAIGRFQFKAILRRPDGQTVRIDGVNQQCPLNGIALLTSTFSDSTRQQENTIALLAGPLEAPLAPKGKHRFTVRELRSAGNALAIPPKSVIILGNGAGKTFLEKLKPGDRIACTLDITPSPGGIQHAVGGGPRLLRNGRISIEAKEEGIAASFVTTRHPRTAFGYNRERIFLVTVDGRQPGYSAGMSLTELADFMLELGAREALNLDGGGSTTMWVRGTVRNAPSDGRVRPIANAVIVFEK
ncbi:MAG: phosphodiester glycosidase family protein, partial [Candidatus Latescibacterota bacterium]